MNKRTQFATSAIIAGVGLVLLAADRFTASASTLTSYRGNFTWITITGLVLLFGSTAWFFWLSRK